MEQIYQASQEQIITALVFGLLFLVLLCVALLLFFFYSRRTIIKKELERAASKLKSQQKILQTAITIQETERKRIAQDLHDAISSKLNIVSLTTNVLLLDDTINDKQRTALEQILSVTTGTLESSRRLAHDLLPPILEKFGLKPALEELIEEYTNTTNIYIESDLIELNNLTKSNQLHIFRIIQELISNSIKHGKANELVIFMTQNNHSFTIRYQDNGSGFNPKEINKNSGIGLQNIKSRVKILNGTLKMESAHYNGSQFTITCNYVP